jgi:aldose 1-epimerase
MLSLVGVTPALMNPVTSRVFGQLPTGADVLVWTLGNAGGATLQVMEYGGIVTRLTVPDRSGRQADVVLGFDSLAPYLGVHPYFGAIAGRVAGRITGGRFTLENKTWPLACNDGPNHLHGGRVGFDKRLWKGTPAHRADGAASVRLELQSADGDEGYPGRLDAAVTFTLTDRNEFLFETELQSDRPTPASLTHHSYFNLAGENAGPVLDHALQIFADTYVPADEFMALSGRRESVAGQAADFRCARRMGDSLPGIFKQHGDLYHIRRPAGAPAALVPAAHVYEPVSGRIMEVSTTEDYLQFYSGVSLDGTLRGKSGVAYGRHHGFCLECEGYPDGANVPELGDILVHPGKPKRGMTAYVFSVD